jgi:hypothetical protein
MSTLETRITRLEDSHRSLVQRLDHLDECVDSVKVQAAENAELVRANAQKWDGRWKLGIGIVIGVALATGSGTVSLKSLLDLFGKIFH